MAEEDVKEIPVNSALAEANKTYETFGKLDDNAIVDFFGRLYGLNVGKKGARTNTGGAILFAVKRMPDEYKWGYVENGQIFNNALAQVDLGLYAQQAKNARDVTNIDKEFDAVSEASANYLASQGSTAETAVPATVQSPSQQGVQPTDSNGFPIDQALVEDMSAQEYLQTYSDKTLLDLGFDKNLKFGLVGIMAGGDAGGDDGIDVYEASRWLYSLSPAQVGVIQDRLRLAGYYDQVGQSYAFENDPNDQATRMAWDLFLVDVVRSGAETSPQELLNKRMATFASNRAAAQGVVLSDITTLQSMANDFGRAMVGRDLSLQEQQRFIAKAREWEREAALGVTFAQENEQIDVRARAEQYFDKQFRIEQSKQIAFDWASKFE